MSTLAVDPQSTLIVTDLDGTLLDHSSYSHDAALPALRLLAEHDIPVVLVSSKTALEIQALRHKIGNHEPFIVENGGALFMPQPDTTGDFETLTLGAERSHVLAFLAKRRTKGDRFLGFNDMSVADVSTHTDLPLDEAAMAAARIASEPIIWQGSDEERSIFLRAVEEAGLRALQGGRFLSIGGKTDKGKAVLRLLQEFRKHERTFQTVIALGDSGNDAAMLEIADIAIWINAGKPTPALSFRQGARCSIARGPQGWCDTLLEILVSHHKELVTS